MALTPPAPRSKLSHRTHDDAHVRFSKHATKRNITPKKKGFFFWWRGVLLLCVSFKASAIVIMYTVRGN